MHGLDSRRPGNFFSSSFLALGLLDLFAELHDLVILVDLRAAVSGEGALAHLSVLLRPPPERRILDSKLTCKLDGLHLAAEVHRWLISGCDGEALYLRCELAGLVPERLPHDLARGGLEGAGLYRAGLCVEPYESGSIVHRKPLP